MNKLFGLLLLALAFLPGGAEAAARFAVCATTCTWDNTSTAMWSTTSGGATGASAPTSADTVTLDANTCVGGTTCTITTFSGTISVQTITWGACTASTTGCIIDASVNNTNFTLSTSAGVTGVFNGSGTGTRQWKAGTGTYNISVTSTSLLIEMSTVTNDTSVFSGATWNLTATASAAGTDVAGGGKSYGPFTINANTLGGQTQFSGANTFASFTAVGPVNLIFNNSITQTVTGAVTFTGSSSTAAVDVRSNSATPFTMSIGSASTGTWVALRSITTSGAAALSATNCYNLGRVTLANSGTCTGPSVGGGGGRIIGG